MNEETHGEDLTQGPILQKIWKLAWPIMLSIFFYTLYNIVDTIWVGKLSTESIAAVSISQISFFVMLSLSMGITVGSGVLLSMAIGAKDKPKAGKILGQSFVLSFLIGLFFTVISLLFKESILTISGASGGVYAPALEYFTIISLGATLMFMMITIVFAFNAQGDSFTSSKLFAISTIINIVLDPILIFGWKFIPALGISGAAYATLISQTVFIIIALRTLSNPKQLIPFSFKNLILKWDLTKQVFKIGIPASLTQVINPLGLAALMLITAKHFQELGTVAFSIAFRIEFFAYLPAIGFGFGSMAIIGQCIGAQKFTRAKEVFYMALKLGAVTALGFGALAIIGAKQIIGIFTTDPIVVSYVTSYLWIVAASYAFLAASLVEASAFQAIGKSWPGFWLFVLRFAIITIPVAYLLTTWFGFSIIGIWIALALGSVVTSLVGFLWIGKTFRDLEKAGPIKTGAEAKISPSIEQGVIA